MFSFLGIPAAKWSTYEKSKITQFLISVKKPSEINRKIRGLDDMAYWKATEYRTFLYYLGIVVLKKYLPDYIYENFLMYFCGITICSSDFYSSKLTVAEKAIETFLNHFIEIYGSQHVFSNMHNLSHLVDDVKKFGCLDKISTYPFENKLHEIKLLLRSGNLPLAQVGFRMIEKENCFRPSQNIGNEIKFQKQIQMHLADIDSYFQGKTYILYNQIEFDDFKINSTDENSWIFTKSREIVKFMYGVRVDTDTFIYGKSINEKLDYFEVPFPSRNLNIFQSNCEFNLPKIFQLNEIICKMFKLNVPQEDDLDENEVPTYKCSTVFIPLLHTLKIN